MKQRSRKIEGLLVALFMFFVMLLGLPLSADAAMVNEQFKVSDGVEYKDIRYSNGVRNQAIRVLEIDTSNPYTYVDIGISNALNKLQRTTALANSFNREGIDVVGAINASFFWGGVPMNLVSMDNKLIHAGEVYQGEEQKYVNEPIAFGVSANGKPMIDYYQLEMSYTHNNRTYDITSTNKIRSKNNTILYTPYYPSKTTGTNSAGTEVVVTLPSNLSLEFGTSVTGKVESIRSKGENTDTVIPDNGFVLSGHGIGSDQMEDIEVGDSIKLQIDIDSKWKDSSFMLASGPMLVKDGKVSLTMDPNSSNARTRAPRSAVAIDRSGEKVFFVTVDGRQAGYSNGMNLSEFADYLIDLGAYQALNLDGGGSTTMAVQYPGTEQVKVANSPSDGYERSVSAILMAISTAPKQIFTDVGNSYWAIVAITNLHNKGVISGYPDGTFRPENSISREHAALMLTLALGLDTSNVIDPGFKDVSQNEKYYKEIAAVANAGLFQGKGNKMFGKNDNLTRAEMTVILQKAYEIEFTDKSYFPDVKENHWGYDFINAIADRGLAGGYADGTFKPNRNVTRAEFSEFLSRAE